MIESPLFVVLSFPVIDVSQRIEIALKDFKEHRDWCFHQGNFMAAADLSTNL